VVSPRVRGGLGGNESKWRCKRPKQIDKKGHTWVRPGEEGYIRGKKGVIVRNDGFWGTSDGDGLRKPGRAWGGC